jgi:hypothetical protein
MDLKLFETLGKIAGLAGISYGVLLVIFLAILKKNLPDPKNTYSLVRQLMYLTFAIGVIGIIAWFFSARAARQISGHVMEKDTKDPLVGADVFFSGRPESTKTDQNGNFYLTLVEQPKLPDGAVAQLWISMKGYQKYEVGVVAGQNIEIDLSPASPAVALAAVNPGKEVPTSPKGDDHSSTINPPPLTDPKTSEATSPTDSNRILVTTETYQSDQVASGACKDFGAWATLCTPDKPKGWTIAEEHFQLTGDRAGCAYAQCEAIGTPTETKACYRFRTQGHDEECGRAGNTGIHYSQGLLTVTWKHQ